MGATVEEIQKHKKTYIAVFVALAVLTVITVAVAQVEFSTLAMGVGIALLVACVKGTLVGGIFMHLFQETKIVYWVLVLTVLFFVVLMALPVMTSSHGNYREGWWGPPAVGAVELDEHGHIIGHGDAENGDATHDNAGDDH